MRRYLFAAILTLFPAVVQSGERMAEFGNFEVERTRVSCIAQTRNEAGDTLKIVFGEGRFNLIVLSTELEANHTSEGDFLVPIFVNNKTWRLLGEIDGFRGSVWIGTHKSLSMQDRLVLMSDLIDGDAVGLLTDENGDHLHVFSLNGSEAAIKYALNVCLQIVLDN
ncbi:hypothetical protein ACFQ3C_03875 [Seohaeicola saemankumensis]|uniref:Uncharacterized protein n=1 Tax=Seohaeicola saemankumensis TaxID=481181 RepID=A0ABW3T9H9_9RHOB